MKLWDIQHKPIDVLSLPQEIQSPSLSRRLTLDQEMTVIQKVLSMEPEWLDAIRQSTAAEPLLVRFGLTPTQPHGSYMLTVVVDAIDETDYEALIEFLDCESPLTIPPYKRPFEDIKDAVLTMVRSPSQPWTVVGFTRSAPDISNVITMYSEDFGRDLPALEITKRSVARRNLSDAERLAVRSALFDLALNEHRSKDK